MGSYFKPKNGMTTVTDHFWNRLAEIKRLIGHHVSAIRTCEISHQNLNDPKLRFPAVFVEPRTWKPLLDTNADYNLEGFVSLYMYVVGDSRVNIVRQITELAAHMEQLFSRNALGDYLSAPTHKYRHNDGFWVDSEMENVGFTPNVAYQAVGGKRYLRGCIFDFRFYDFSLHN
jgi:hypothetical protein